MTKLCSLVAALALAACALADEEQPPAASFDLTLEVNVVRVSAAALGGAGPALAALAATMLRAHGQAARVVPATSACAVPDSRACFLDMLDGLESLRLSDKPHVVLVPVASMYSLGNWQVERKVKVLGYAAPPQRLGCRASLPARSLLDLADARIAATYAHTCTDLRDAHVDFNRTYCINKTNSSDSVPLQTCLEESPHDAIVLTDDSHAARAVAREASRHRLAARVAVLPGGLQQAARSLAARGCVVLCEDSFSENSTQHPQELEPLGVPLCGFNDVDCTFEPRRLLKLASKIVGEVAAFALQSLELSEVDLKALVERSAAIGPEEAAQKLLHEHPEWLRLKKDLIAIVMLPINTTREVVDVDALRAAARLAESHAENATVLFKFKVQILNDDCEKHTTFQHLFTTLRIEFRKMSGILGSACGGAFGNVMQIGYAQQLQALAYTPQVAEGERGALLAAGDASAAQDAWAAVLKRLGWRRLAAFTELAARSAVRLPAALIDHFELQHVVNYTKIDYKQITAWAERVRAARGRVVLVGAEDARAVRSALCAGLALDAAWLLPGTLPTGWLRRRDADAHPCSQDQLDTAAEGHLSLAPAWVVRWEREPPPARWMKEWQIKCKFYGLKCGRTPPPYAGILYDTLRLWFDALVHLVSYDPFAVDHLHDKKYKKMLVEFAAQPYNGTTGVFDWVRADSNWARDAPLVLRQWRNGSYVEVGEWRRGELTLGPEPLVWHTADGSAPDDGQEVCTLQLLAATLNISCEATLWATGALALAVLLGTMSGAAWYCRRRAERAYRARLDALGLCRLDDKPGGLDHWEVPRERVVINRKLGTGAFGTVYGGHALLAEGRGWSAVAVKTLKAGASTEEKLDFLSEAEAMKRFDHRNVVRLLGVVTKTEPVCTVMEFMLYGDLKNYLLARRHLAGAADATDEVSPARLTAMALGAARALSYLAQLRYVHRDVAARNCLVGADRQLKLADFGMTRLVFESDYYRFSRKGMLPVRWMAPESLTLGVFSPASDVWSFGVLLYEIVTFGSLPFQGLSNAEVLARVKAGGTAELPTGLKPQLESLMRGCWRREARARPRVSELAAQLVEAPRLLVPCLDGPLDALPLDAEPSWRESRDRAQARWVSWAAPASAATDSTELSAESAPRDTDAFLP